MNKKTIKDSQSKGYIRYIIVFMKTIGSDSFTSIFKKET